MKKVYKLSDDSISQVAKLLQVALLTGTDIVDNLRTLELCVVKESLVPSPDYLENFETNLSKMIEQAEQAAGDTSSE